MPSPRAVLDPGAVQDLKDIREFIARDKPFAATQWIRRLRTEIQMLARDPGIGHARREIAGAETCLFWPVREYEIVYERTGFGIYVHFVAAPGRDLRILVQQRVVRRV